MSESYTFVDVAFLETCYNKQIVSDKTSFKTSAL